MTSGFKFLTKALFGLCLATAFAGDTMAKRLPSKVCVKLVKEHAAFARSNVEKVMNANPEKASATLKPEQLARIERFLFIEGQIRFRCPEIKLPGLGVPEPSKTLGAKIDKKQAAELKKKRDREREGKKAAKLKKKQPTQPKGPAVPFPKRKPGRASKSAG